MGGGFGIGAIHAVAVQPEEEIFLTDNWSYVPKDSWWMHGLVVGVSIALVYAAVLIGFRLVALLLRGGVLFTVGGLLLVAAAVFFFVQAAIGDDGTGGKIAWVTMGLVVGGLGVPMIWMETRRRLGGDD